MKNLGLIRIISGGQTGADQAGLRAAKKLGISTTGWIPKGFKTEDGDKPSLGFHYGLVETKDRDYKKRTFLNINMAEGTIVFTERPSKGSLLTEDVCYKMRKPYCINPGVDEIRMFINEHEIQVLNIAGNRESVSPGIGSRVETLLMRAIGGVE